MHAHTRKHNSHVLCRVLYNRAHDTIHREQPARQYHMPQLYYTHHDISNNVTDTCTLAAWGAPLCRLCLILCANLYAIWMQTRMSYGCTVIILWFVSVCVCVRISLKRSINNRRTFVKLFHILGPGAYYNIYLCFKLYFIYHVPVDHSTTTPKKEVLFHNYLRSCERYFLA